MATRGTYQIKMEYTEKDGKIVTHENKVGCIYCSSDNYPSGAVIKFKATFELQKELKDKILSNCGFIECFIAANIHSSYLEITEGHESHYDTDYAYDILISDDIYLKAYRYLGWGSSNDNTKPRDKELYYDGLLKDFINNDAINLLDR